LLAAKVAVISPPAPNASRSRTEHAVELQPDKKPTPKGAKKPKGPKKPKVPKAPKA